MFGQADDPFSGDCINASFQGCFDRRQFEEEERLSGTGLLLDDEFNLFMSEWRQNKLNGSSFLRMISGHMVYGQFQLNAPTGVVAIEFEQYRMFLCGSRAANGVVSWKREAVIINNQANLFYLLELQQREGDADSDRNQKTSSESSRLDKSRGQWKIKIVDRCQLRKDGKLAGYSKLIKSRQLGKHLQYFKNEFTEQEQNYIYLLSTVLGNALTDPHIISPAGYLRQMAVQNKRWSVQETSDSEDRDDWLFVSLASERHGGSKQVDKRLGMLMSSSFGFVRSLGSYNHRMKMNGLGIEFSRRGECSIGIFKEDLLVKEYVGGLMGEGVSTFPMREILVQQHLRSLNYIHHCHYMSELAELVGLSNKIVKYVGAFEREYEKRHYSYNDTMADHSTSSDAMNVMKYVEDERRNFDFADQLKSEEINDSGRRESKKPGFIVKKENNKSKEKDLSKSPQGKPSSPRKSPLRPIRITGRISSGYSPSDKKTTSPLKENASTIRRGGY